MSFIDEYLPRAVSGLPFISSPRFKTSIQVNASGKERRKIGRASCRERVCLVV